MAVCLVLDRPCNIGFEEFRIQSLSHTDYGAEDFGLIGFR